MPKSSSPVPDIPLLRTAWDYADERLGLSEVMAFAAKKKVPQHKHSFWYYWGGISLFFFLAAEENQGARLRGYTREASEGMWGGSILRR